MIGVPRFDRFEQGVVDLLQSSLEGPDSKPLMTIDENDVLIEVESLYFDKVTQIFTPHNVISRIRSGELTEKDVQNKRNAGRAIVRRKKVDMFADRLMTATYAADTCRSLYRVVTNAELIPVDEDDSVETLQHRVGDYVTDLLIAGRQTRLLRGAAMLRTTDKIRHKFDTDPAAQLLLTGLAGRNSMKKAQLWLGEFFRISGGFNKDRMAAETEDKLLRYAASRPIEYQEKFNLLQVLADLKR